MKNMMKEAPEVAQSFFDLAKSAREYSTLGMKTNELILLGIFAAHRGLRGIQTRRPTSNGRGSDQRRNYCSYSFSTTYCRHYRY